jgi:hypothetical protein
MFFENEPVDTLLQLVCRQLFQVRKTDIFSVMGYEPLIFDLDHHTRAWSRKKSRLTTLKNRTSKIRVLKSVDVEAKKPPHHHFSSQQQ